MFAASPNPKKPYLRISSIEQVMAPQKLVISSSAKPVNLLQSIPPFERASALLKLTGSARKPASVPVVETQARSKYELAYLSDLSSGQRDNSVLLQSLREIYH